MKAPSLRRAAALSAALHLTFFIVSFLILRQSNNMMMPSPYVVNLVSPGAAAPKYRDTAPAVSDESGTAPVAAEKRSARDRIDEKKEQKRIEDSISELKAKQKKLQQLEKIQNLKRALVSIQGKPGAPNTRKSAQKPATGTAAGEAGYTAIITGEIHKHWEVPNVFTSENLQADINVRIGRDGTLFVEGFEKKSGNRLFDKLALKTIEKASPVTPPPSEMEIVIRFSPKDGI